MEHAPKRCPSPEACRVQRIEQIVADEDEYPDQQHGPQRQKDQTRQRDHAATDGPERGQMESSELKRPYWAHHDCIEQDQPYAAGQQEARERASIIELPSVQKRGHAREEDEGWRAIMGDEAGQE